MQRRAGPAAIAGRPLTSLLIPIPILCFLAAVVTDWAYLSSNGYLLWLFFSAWLIPAGLLFGAIAMIALLADSIRLRGRWLGVILMAAGWAVELINAFVHMRDGWTAVAGLGIILSIVGALLALASGWVAAGLRRRRVEGLG